ncbi:hypothetical protein A6R68_03785, partial [Neotoma lepida]
MYALLDIRKVTLGRNPRNYRRTSNKILTFLTIREAILKHLLESLPWVCILLNKNQKKDKCLNQKSLLISALGVYQGTHSSENPQCFVSKKLEAFI